MNSTWKAEIFAVLKKEWMTEVRSKSGLITAALFGIVTVYTISFITMYSDIKQDGTVKSSLLWVAMLFSVATSLPRSFISEEEQGTADLLRLVARPHAVFWGKSIFNIAGTLLTGALLSTLYLTFSNAPLEVPWLFVVSLVFGSVSLASAVTLCGAIASQAANRAVLSATIALPMLLPLVALGIGAMRFSLDLNNGTLQSSSMAAVGLVGYAVATVATGPWIFAAVWKS